MSVTDRLSSILAARESRWLRRLDLSNKGTLLTLTMNLPGSDKNLPRWNAAHSKITNLIKEDMKEYLLFFEERETLSGAESYFVVNFSGEALKKYAIALEEGHPIGRLLDADVMGKNGLSIGRESVGLPQRRCLCCDRSAKVCARENRHSLREILMQAEKFLDMWKEDGCVCV